MQSKLGFVANQCICLILLQSVKNADADPTQAKKVSLICQMPPLRKMDAALNTLVNCESANDNLINKSALIFFL